jgi:tRNA threonylcarbamoyladenosine biosynthesis protein TsaE
MQTVISRSPDQTIAIGRFIGERLTAGTIVALSGTLGAGKTWLAKGIAYGLGVPDYEYVNSPAYDLIHEYAGRMPVFHLDLYRLAALSLDDELMVQEVYAQPGVVLIEWPERLERLPALKPTHQLRIRLDLNDDETVRTLTLEPGGAAVYEAIVQAVVAAFE